MSPFLTSLITLVGGVVGLLLVAGLIARNYKKAAPNKALVFFGRRNRIGAGKLVGAKIITSGGKFKWPIVEDVAELDLSTFQMQVDLRDIPNKDGVLVNVNAVATCKIKSDEVSLNAAAERFLGKSRQEIETLIRENLEGQLRAVIGTLTVEDVITNRDVLNNKVKAEAVSELETVGVGIDILNIQSITDSRGYIEALGKKRTAEVVRDADIGTAEAQRDAKKQSTTAEKDGNVTAAENAALTAEAEKTLGVKKATYDAEVKAEQARAAQAGPLASAQAQQQVKIETVKIEELEQTARIAVEAEKVKVTAQTQHALKVVPAEKQAAASIATAEGDKKAQVLASEGAREAAINAAEAEKQKRTREGEGEAAKIEATGRAEAAKIEAIGLAEAKAIQAKLEAEAAGILKKAEAYKALDDAAMNQLILEKLPGILQAYAAVVAAAAKPMEAIDKVVIIGGDANGVKSFASSATEFLAGFNEKAKALGIDVSGLLAKAGIKSVGIADDPTPGK